MHRNTSLCAKGGQPRGNRQICFVFGKSLTEEGARRTQKRKYRTQGVLTGVDVSGKKEKGMKKRGKI